MGGSELQRRVERLLAPSLEAMGYEIVRVQLSGGRSPTLQVMAERLDQGPMTVDDCAAISRAASALLDVEDPVAGAYMLEISSPGIDRPLVRPKDFARFAGHEVKAETTHPIDGRRRFRGRLLGIDNGIVRLALDIGTAELPYEAIQKARLVLSDELLTAAAARGASKEG
ncbi:MAG TPA: ribosome maturation factor RimP [Alphaproteobacteria bacterium]|nr:ribosome maturation factor RimP [Alphaproteobacteria bacterium]